MTADTHTLPPDQASALLPRIRELALALGFQQLAVTDIDLSAYRPHLDAWLARNFHGDMDYMSHHRDLRLHPESLHPGTIRVLSVRMDYSLSAEQSLTPLKNRERAYISRYARGRDYHKLIRKRLQKLADGITELAGPMGYRAFVDSAPVLERALAEKAGLGWIGKNTMLLNKKAGSWFFLGELFTDLPLPIDAPVTGHCGSCTACLDICPTQAFVGPNQLDARRCISYLTIELKGSIPEPLRAAIGNRVFGCDDCQLICPWNKFSQLTSETDFAPRHGLDNTDLSDLFMWSEETFLRNTEGSAIRRTGYEGWLRNLAVGLGNAPSTIPVLNALQSRQHHPSALVREHVAWALRQHALRADATKA
ncbi:tRNA epoxyqueuosine(34) reductase QueG [Pseudohongiella acticola]|uniref:Epoxyqueuosine reductase n=1 Tax=Pseudohongiella acticola TaxID=1524254 RepID=A0A1E8CLM3_9GAMM|nr:tRNA epoxyqueuosine(34) reductase QueG [Pseudohongiella acticola]OFE13376.1 tRNA epoxyqueuosine(34) reductase QueG [Pseudohongiella acticola]